MKRYVIIAFLLVLVLGITGFAPGPSASVHEWRGKISSHTLYAFAPISDVVSDLALQAAAPAYRGRIRNTVEAVTPAYLPESSPVLDLQTNGVSILTSQAPQVIYLLAETTPSLANAFVSPLPVTFRSTGYDFEQDMWGAGGRQILVNSPMGGILPDLARQQTAKAGDVVLSLAGRIRRYQPAIDRYAAKYRMDVSLIMAIIHVESGFNPNAVSSRDAHGLMQIVPATAGEEVHRWLGKSGLPSSDYLMEPENNILYGVLYMNLLQRHHLEGITDSNSLEYCAIASYNGGSGAVLRHFGQTREQAVLNINALSPQEVLHSLTTDFPARETRSFVRKVLDYRWHYLTLAAQAQASPAV